VRRIEKRLGNLNFETKGVSPSSKKDFTKFVRECYFSILPTALIQNLKSKIQN
jgi:hypothetical protein